MIEPHSAQLGASSWILNATFALPSDSVTVDPFPFDAFPGAAWPLVATTASSSRAGEEAPLETKPAAATGEEESELDAPTLGESAGKAEEPPLAVVASLEEEAVETAELPLGASLEA